MKSWRVRQPSLLWRVLLVTSAATILLFPATAYLIARFAISNTEQSVEAEVQASLQDFEFLWRTRADSLARSSRLLSTMSDVRGAFLTRDAATIRDTAADLWSRVSQEDAVFLVFDPLGGAIASLGGSLGSFPSMRRILPEAKRQFPNQAAGFLVENGRLYYTILTPVYVTSGSGPALLNVLVTGFEINDRFARSLGRATEGSDFVFTAAGKTVASTLASSAPAVAEAVSPNDRDKASRSLQRAWIGGNEYAALTDPLLDLFGKPVGRLSVMRSLAASNRRFHDLKNRIGLILAVAIVVALLISYALARHIIDPIHRLDQAAAEVSRRNYGYRLAIDRDDELGRLAGTFNAMCDSIQAARQELISQERLNTIGRLSSSIVHDLRNPLAAIYGGAEMLADNETLPPQQSRRLAVSIYRASRHIQEMLSDLADSARGKAEPIETCRLFDIVDAARTLLAQTAENQGASITVEIPQEFELPLERSRMERVFLNLMSNSLEAMRGGGCLTISAREEPKSYLIEIDDTGSGISEEARKQLFLPFFSQGKRSGLGLGLALSRQTVLDHGGELWVAQKREPGARFYMRLPLVAAAVRKGSVQVA
jgi:signal transduction histidine kinase